ncbi:MAG: UdgX family uracil-DNA binding protein [Rubricoccaceae bacterium]|nr:UdgX family uracil-DNA binding protein [Rubricoccaceae bacterium]
MTTAADFLPLDTGLPSLRASADHCRGCALHEHATQTVFGQGRADAELMLVGEQPGNVEDRRGTPFVGPAGQLLDQALDDAGIRRGDVYLTNVVKHFKWRPGRQGMRLHATPNTTEVLSCLPWLKAEIETVRPRVLVCLGRTAARALIHPSLSLAQYRGTLFTSQLVPHLMPTLHPAAVLRAPPALRESAFADLVHDLATAADTLTQDQDLP